ncbi:hypothetical protein IC575_028429 [Cucumis melo]
MYLYVFCFLATHLKFLIGYCVLVCVISVEKLLSYFVSNAIFNNFLCHCSYSLSLDACSNDTKIYKIGKMGLQSHTSFNEFDRFCNNPLE